MVMGSESKGMLPKLMARWAIPLTRMSKPMAREAIPLTRMSKPMAREAILLARMNKPMAREVKPLTRAAALMARRAILLTRVSKLIVRYSVIKKPDSLYQVFGLVDCYIFNPLMSLYSVEFIPYCVLTLSLMRMAV
jgi:hypothetical protein